MILQSSLLNIRQLSGLHGTYSNVLAGEFGYRHIPDYRINYSTHSDHFANRKAHYN